jgi:ABC-type cobalt transport system substrate-binding protein
MGANSRSRAIQAARKRRRRVQVASMVTAGAVIVAIVIVIAVTRGFVGGNDQAAGSTVTATQGSVGKPFPAFSLAAPGGGQVTKSSLLGKPSIVWFVGADSSMCPSCASSALQVRQLDRNLGGSAFRVLLVFVNASGSASTLTAWRNAYGEPNWLVAADGGDQLAVKVKIPCLDTKLVLNRQGNIVGVNSTPVDASYVSQLRGELGL